MELRYAFMIYVGCGLAIFFALVPLGKTKLSFKSGKKLGTSDYVTSEKYFVRKLRMYKILKMITVAFCILAILATSLVISRPTKITKESIKQYNRDIVICMDVSASVDELNEDMVDQIKEMVEGLHGERFSLVIFNTSPATVIPLTSDYEFVLRELDKLKEALHEFNSDNWYISSNTYITDYLYNGTLVGNELRGSSLIGDGLAGAIYNFDLTDEDRSRIIIFTTDNQVEGNPIVTLQEAADLCVKYDITVYGIGTDMMFSSDAADMKSAVEKTGGIFYRENESGNAKDIVSQIQTHEKSLVEGGIEVHKADVPRMAFLLLFTAVLGLFAFARILKV